MFDIITSGELISRSTRTVRRPVQYCHPPPAKSLPSRSSAVSTIGTNVEPPEIRYGGTVMLSPVLLRSFGSVTASADALPPSIRQGVQVATVADYSSFGG